VIGLRCAPLHIAKGPLIQTGGCRLSMALSHIFLKRRKGQDWVFGRYFRRHVTSMMAMKGFEAVPRAFKSQFSLDLD
jgi:hypothetical protein